MSTEPIKKLLVNCEQTFTDAEKLRGQQNLGAVGGVKVSLNGTTTELIPDADNKVTVNLSTSTIPDVGASDNGKVLTASYNGSEGTYGWEDVPNELPGISSSDNGKVLGVTDSSGTLGWVSQTPAQVNSDWNAVSGVAQILNRPENLVQDASYVHTDNNFTDALKNKLDGIESGAEVNVQASWSQTNSAADDYIKDKPENLVQDASYVHTDNNFTDALKNKLDGIEAGAEVNVQASWTQTNSDADDYIQNKPVLSAVATSGAYSDLSGTPTINNVPAVTSSDDNKVLKASYSGGVGSYSWENESGGTVTDVQVNGTSVVSGGVASITVPAVDQTYNSSSTNAQSGTAVAGAISQVRQVPSSTASDENKVLTVNSSGTPVWGDGPKEVFYATYNSTTYNDILDACYAGKLVVLLVTSGDIDYEIPLSKFSATEGDKYALFNSLTNVGSNAAPQGVTYIVTSSNTWISREFSQKQVDWNQSISGAVDFIKNKPSLSAVATSGAYSDLTGTPTIPAAQVQSDWAQSDNSVVDYIKNKPALKDIVAGSGVTITATANGVEISASGSVPTPTSADLGKTLKVTDTSGGFGWTTDSVVRVKDTVGGSPVYSQLTQFTIGTAKSELYGVKDGDATNTMLGLFGPYPTSSGVDGKFLQCTYGSNNNCSADWATVPFSKADLQLLTQQNVTYSSGGNNTLTVENGYSYSVTLDGSVSVIMNLATLSEDTIHTIIKVSTNASTDCAGFEMLWYDEGLNQHGLTLDMIETNKTYFFDVYLKRVYSNNAWYTICRVHDFPCGFRPSPGTGTMIHDSNTNWIGVWS